MGKVIIKALAGDSYVGEENVVDRSKLEKEMGLNYNTKELLLSHEEVKKYIEWRKKRI